MKIPLDDAFDCYEQSKRKVTLEPLFGYDTEKKEFVKLRDKNRNVCVVFVNSYQLCSSLIEEYLSQPSMEEHRKAFKELSKNSSNKIVSFLWYFEHIDGCRDFEMFEIKRVSKALKKWCKANNFEWTEPEVYRID